MTKDLTAADAAELLAKATPGPWRGDRRDGTVKYDVLGADDSIIIHGDNNNNDDGPYGILGSEGDDNLIIASPSLARALIRAEGERDAFAKAKAENDERYMIERDEARRDGDALRAYFRHCTRPDVSDAERAELFAAMAIYDQMTIEDWVSEMQAPNVRLRDLVRHQRGPLHDAGLLTDAEYAALAADSESVARLEGYDQMRALLTRARDSLAYHTPDGPSDDADLLARIDAALGAK